MESATLKTEDIRAFVAVVRHKSISRAAEAMQISQSVVTRRVQSLEETLGVELLNRNTKPPVPTAIGLKVFDQALAVVHQLEQLNGIALSPADAPARLRIGMPQFLGEALSFGAVQHLKASHPALAIQITTALSPTLMDSVELGEIDAALVVLPHDSELPARLSGTRVGDFRVGIVGLDADYPVGSQTLRTLHERGWILNPPGCGFRATLERTLADQGLPITLNLDVFGTELQFGLVAKGLGLGLVPAFMLASSSHAARLKILDVQDFAPRNDIWLIEAGNSARLRGVIGAFRQFVVDELASA